MIDDLSYRIIADQPIDFARFKRRRIRVLLPPGARLEAKATWDLATKLARASEASHGPQRAIAVQFYTDIFTTSGGIGSWDRCPAGIWEQACSDSQKEQMWVICPQPSMVTSVDIIKAVKARRQSST